VIANRAPREACGDPSTSDDTFFPQPVDIAHTLPSQSPGSS
jgi:hypothetical protein